MFDTVFLHAMLVFFSVAGAFIKWLHVNKETPSTYTVLAIEAGTAAFTGGLVCGIYTWTNCPYGLAFVLSGMSGYLGTKAIDIIGMFVAKRFNIDMPVTSGDKQKKVTKNSEEQ